MSAIQLPVKATLVYNFGKFDYVYKPKDEKGENMLKLVIAQGTTTKARESKRQNFSKTDCLKAIELAHMNGISLEFMIVEVNQPEVPAKPVLNTPVQFNKAMPVQRDVDLGFLA